MEERKEVRTRFAPSPTGWQHIGGFRSAVFSWLLARHYGGKFILRIEDTDQTRKVEGAVKFILEGFQWLGLDIDEGPSHDELEAISESVTGFPNLGGSYGPYIQSLRLDKYRQVAEDLIKLGVAYRCDCTAEMLQKERLEQIARKEVPGYSGYCRTRNVSKDRPHVIRFKMPYKPKLEIIDGVRGRISWEDVPIKDPVLLKSDGFPTYHLAVCVDDHYMDISHIMRGEEWIPSTPIHLLIYQALGWTPPIFCHLPAVLGADGKKLSKRHGAVSWKSFKEQGYLPEALLNFIVKIGWSPGDGEEREIFSKEELIELFSLDHINSASGVFEYNKLNWMNGVYIRKLSFQDFTSRVKHYLDQIQISSDSKEWRILGKAVQERIKLLPEVKDMLLFLKDEGFSPDKSQLPKVVVEQGLVKDIIKAVLDKLTNLKSFEASLIEGALKEVAKELKLKSGAVMLTVRIAITGKKATPPLSESILALGKEKTIKRLNDFIK